MAKHARCRLFVLIYVTLAYSSGSPQDVERSRSFFGCSSDIKQLLSECLEKCQNVSCQSQELQNFISACKSGTKQICTTMIKPDPICNPLCVNGKCDDGRCKCDADYKGPSCTDKIDECDQCGVANTRKIKESQTKRKSSAPRRISRGKKVKPPRKYPWQVLVIGAYDCGGSIINNRWILTAAHCLDTSFQKMKVTVGEHHKSATRDDDPVNTKVYNVKRQIPHPDYELIIDGQSESANNDFALLELKSEIPFNSVIRPVCLPEDDSKTYDGVKATVSGWGVTQKQTGSDVLREADVYIDADCKGYDNLPDDQLCAVSFRGKDACAGDSGGPLVVKEGNRYIQVGVVSYGDECDGSLIHTGVYAKVSKVLDWIKETTASGKC